MHVFRRFDLRQPFKKKIQRFGLRWKLESYRLLETGIISARFALTHT